MIGQTTRALAVCWALAACSATGEIESDGDGEAPLDEENALAAGVIARVTAEPRARVVETGRITKPVPSDDPDSEPRVWVETQWEIRGGPTGIVKGHSNAIDPTPVPSLPAIVADPPPFAGAGALGLDLSAYPEPTQGDHRQHFELSLGSSPFGEPHFTSFALLVDPASEPQPDKGTIVAQMLQLGVFCPPSISLDLKVLSRQHFELALRGRNGDGVTPGQGETNTFLVARSGRLSVGKWHTVVVKTVFEPSGGAGMARMWIDGAPADTGGAVAPPFNLGYPPMGFRCRSNAPLPAEPRRLHRHKVGPYRDTNERLRIYLDDVELGTRRPPLSPAAAE